MGRGEPLLWGRIGARAGERTPNRPPPLLAAWAWPRNEPPTHPRFRTPLLYMGRTCSSPPGRYSASTDVVVVRAAYVIRFAADMGRSRAAQVKESCDHNHYDNFLRPMEPRRRSIGRPLPCPKPAQSRSGNQWAMCKRDQSDFEYGTRRPLAQLARRRTGPSGPAESSILDFIADVMSIWRRTMDAARSQPEPTTDQIGPEEKPPGTTK